MEKHKQNEQCSQSDGKAIEEGILPFTWMDALKSFEPGQTKRYRVNAGLVSTIRSHLWRFQNEYGAKFSSRCDEEYMYITRLE